MKLSHQQNFQNKYMLLTFNIGRRKTSNYFLFFFFCKYDKSKPNYEVTLYVIPLIFFFFLNKTTKEVNIIFKCIKNKKLKKLVLINM